MLRMKLHTLMHICMKDATDDVLIQLYIYIYIHTLTYAVGNLYYFGVTKLLTSALSNFEKIIRLVCTLSWG